MGTPGGGQTKGNHNFAEDRASKTLLLPGPGKKVGPNGSAVQGPPAQGCPSPVKGSERVLPLRVLLIAARAATVGTAPQATEGAAAEVQGGRDIGLLTEGPIQERGQVQIEGTATTQGGTLHPDGPMEEGTGITGGPVRRRI